MGKRRPELSRIPLGIDGQDLRARGMEQARRFHVEVVEDTIESLQRNHDGFQLRGAATIYRGRRVLLATGLTHLPPEIEGVRECLGVGQCGWIEPSGFAVEQVIELAGYRVALYHRPYERGRLTRDGASFLKRTNPAVCVYGHTHQPKSEWREGVLLFNPGSAGPKRFHLPRALGLLLFHHETVEPQHITLADRAE